MLGRRRRRWANVGPTVDLCVVFAGMLHYAFSRSIYYFCVKTPQVSRISITTQGGVLLK